MMDECSVGAGVGTAAQGPVRVLYLYSEVMGYTLATIRELVACGAEVDVIHWDRRKLSGFELSAMPGLKLHPRSSLSADGIEELAARLAPDITVVSGWQDRGYLAACRALRRQGRAVVCGFDDQWFGTARQVLAGTLGRLGLLKRFYSHAWVTGPRQFEYARRFGFAPAEIVFDLYSGDLPLFNRSYQRSRIEKSARYPRRFLFAGRLEPIKGVAALVESWNALRAARGNWELVVAGAGSLGAQLENLPGVSLTGFLQPPELAKQADHAGCFVLPSKGEPWGVVIHEFAAAGLPIVTSTAVGAGSVFVINGYNGFLFDTDDVGSLTAGMRQIMASADSTLAQFGARSHEMAQRITPRTSAANLFSILRGQQSKTSPMSAGAGWDLKPR